MKQIGSAALASSGRTLSAQAQNCGRTAQIVEETVEDCYPRCSKPLAFRPLSLEARVGIEQTSAPCLRIRQLRRFKKLRRFCASVLGEYNFQRQFQLSIHLSSKLPSLAFHSRSDALLCPFLCPLVPSRCDVHHLPGPERTLALKSWLKRA